MKAVILSGGEGTRLREISGDCPKPMMPLLGKPLLERTVDLLRENGFDRICVTLHYHPGIIRQFLGDGGRFGVRIEYRLEDIPLGTAGAVRNCMDFVGSEPFLVISGDSACDYDLSTFFREHKEGVTIALSESAEPLSYGLVLTDRTGRVTGFLEKPAWEHVVTDRVSTGIYVLSPDILDCVPENTKFDFAADLFPKLLDQGIPIRGRIMEGYWCDIGTPRAYYQCNLDAIDGLYRIPGQERPFQRIIPCRNRARLMRVMSEALAEFGADYSDGLSFSTKNGRVHLAPLADRSALALDGDLPAVHAVEALIRKFDPEN